jgi:hypothetical protein
MIMMRESSFAVRVVRVTSLDIRSRKFLAGPTIGIFLPFLDATDFKQR